MTDLEARLRKIDPAKEWAVWEPSQRDPWGAKWAGHLYRRAAFGGSWPQIQAAVKAGPAAAVEKLLTGGAGLEEFDQIMDAVAPGQPSPRRGGLQAEGGLDLEGWWLHRMVLTPHPLQERMTLFWHNHFATSVTKVRLPELMRDQNVLLRRHALGKFDTLVQEISRDPAMLVWLDSNSNTKGRPNENYAREVMELFCLGVGNYTEKDVQEAARAFTGWHTNVNVESGGANGVRPAFTFRPALHDDDEKTVLGRTGNWDGTDVVKIVLGRPECARFVVRKLYRHFVGEAVVPPDSFLDPLAETFRSSGYDTATVMKVIFRSRHFYSAFAHRQRVKGPVEYLVGLLRALEAKLPADAATGTLAMATQGLGQTLFAPPSVKGWDGGPAWLNTATLLGRTNASWRVLQEPGTAGVRINPPGLLTKHAPDRDPAGQVAFLLDLLLQPDAGEIDEKATKLLAEYLGRGQPRGLSLDRRLREVLHAVASMPLAQMA